MRWSIGLGALVALALPAQAVGGSLQGQAFSDSLSWTPPTKSTLAALKQDQCVRASRQRPLTFSAGLASARRALSRLASRRAVDAMAHDRQTHEPRAARVVAAAALIENRPTAALAALLDAQRVGPHDPQTLVDLASVLIRLQMPREALAVLSGVKLLPRLPTPMGIQLKAVLTNDRGLALLRLGHDRQAVQLLNQAIAQAPSLHEAKLNRAVAQLCAGGPATFPPVWADPLIDPPIKNPNTGAETPDPSSVFDLSQGVTGTLPYVPYPDSYQQTAATADAYKALVDQYSALSTQDATQGDTLIRQYQATHPSSLTDQRTNAIFGMINNENQWPPAIQQLSSGSAPLSGVAGAGVPAEFQADLSRASDACSGASDFAACYRPKCQAAATARNSEWRTDMVTWDSAERAFFAAYYRYATGLAANFSIAPLHEAGLIGARALGDAIIAAPQGLVDSAHTWADTLATTDCLQPPTNPQATGAGSTPASPACPAQLKAMKLSLKWSFLKASVSCEKFDLEESTPGPIGLFGQVSYNRKTGETTIFAGGKVGTDLSGPLSGSAKTGAYIKVGADGSITDFGWRFNPSAAASFGAGSISAADSMDFSFVPSAAGGSLLSG